MKISYATTHRWRKEVTSDSLSLFGASEQKKIKDTLKKVSESDVAYVIEPLSEEFLSWWSPMYETHISTKDNPKVFNVREKTLGNTDKEKTYFSLTLKEGDDRLGGVIFSLKDDVLFFCHRTLAYDWKRAKLRASPSLFVEYVLAEHAREIGMKQISHGVDRNPYGLNSSIGLAGFKLSTGCRPQLAKEYEVSILDTQELNKNALILELPNDSGEHANITKAYLVADKAGIEKWSSVLKYEDRLVVEVIEREES